MVVLFLIFSGKTELVLDIQGTVVDTLCLVVFQPLLFQNIFFLDQGLANTRYQVGVEMHLIFMSEIIKH